MGGQIHRAPSARGTGLGNDTGAKHPPSLLRQPDVNAGTAIRSGKHRARCDANPVAEQMLDALFRFDIRFVHHNGVFGMHAHDYPELAVVLGGRGLRAVEQRKYSIEEGDVFVVTGNTQHGLIEARNLQLCNIHFDPRQFLHGHRVLDDMAGYRALFDFERDLQGGSAAGVHLTTPEMLYVTSLLATLRTEFETRDEGWEVFVRSTFLLLVSYVSRLHGAHKKQPGTPVVRLANVMSYITNHFREPLRIVDMARQAHLSASQFQRLFKRIYHTTPQKFVRQMRLHEACELLKDPNRDITNVAYDCGFSSSSFFAAHFKRELGETPSHYRRRKLQQPDATLSNPPIAPVAPLGAPQSPRAQL